MRKVTSAQLHHIIQQMEGVPFKLQLKMEEKALPVFYLPQGERHILSNGIQLQTQ